MTTPPAVEGSLMGARGVRLRTARWDSPTPSMGLLIVHGFGQHVGRWDPIARRLGADGISVFAFDQRGHGRSEGRRGRLESFDDLVEDIRRAHAEAERVTQGDGPPAIYAHSMGALAVTRYLQADRPPVPAVVLSAPWLATAVPVPWWKRATAAVLLRVAPHVTLRGELNSAWITGDPEEARAYETDPLIHRRISPRFFNEVERAQSAALAEGIDPSIPTLVLVPAADRIVDSDVTLRWARSLGPHVTVDVLDGTQHEPHHDVGREVVLDRVARWLRAHSRADEVAS